MAVQGVPCHGYAGRVRRQLKAPQNDFLAGYGQPS